MPISGPGGPTGPRGVVPAAPKEAVEEAQAPAATEAARPAGWAPSQNSRQPLNLELVPPPALDLSQMPNPVEGQVRAALDTYQRKVEVALHHDAMSIARGQTPVREGDPMTAEQTKALNDAAVDLVKDLPLGVLAPDMMARAQQGLQDAGIKSRDIPSTKLGDVGRIGGDVAQDLVKQLRADSPKTFYGIAAGLAGAAGVVAYTGGSEKLSRLGIKPEVTTKLYDDNLKLKLKGEWGSHFKDFQATGELSSQFNLGEYGKLEGAATFNTAKGFENARLQYSLEKPEFNLSAVATANSHGVETLSGSANWRPNQDFSLSVGASHNFQTNASSATAEATWHAAKNVDFALSGRTNFAGDSYVGVGVAVKF